MTKKLLTTKDLRDLYGFSRASIYNRMARGDFPKPVKIGHSVRWRAEVIARFIDERTPPEQLSA